jgi:signal transduction histidine kinase
MKAARLRSQMLLIVVVGSILLSLGFLGVSWTVRKLQVSREVRLATEAAAVRLADSLAVPLWALFSEATDRILSSELTEGDFSAVVLRDPQGSLLAARLRDAPSSTASEAELEGLAASALATASRLILKEGLVLGRISVYADGLSSRTRAFRSQLGSALFILVQGTSLALLLWFLIDRRVIGRIKALGDAIGAYAAGDRDARARDPRRDEIGKLASIFNGMADSLGSYAANLEKLVQERTRDLELKNAELAAALGELKGLERKLVQSEREAALGQLVAGIAHQLNTPLGAIQSGAGNLVETSGRAVAGVAERLARLDEVETAVLAECLDESAAAIGCDHAGENRERKRALRAALEKEGRADASAIADLAVESCLDSLGSRLLEFSSLPHFTAILEIVDAVADIRRSAEIVRLGTERAANVIQALKAYFELGTEEESRSLHLARELEECLDLYRYALKGGVELYADMDRSCRIRGRHGQLALVWMVLIDNAIAAMSGRGRLGVRVSRCGEEVSVEIADSGVGIPEDLRERLFQPFSGTKLDQGGLGLGLHATRKIVEEHGGRIAFSSAPGKTVFTVTLPAEEGA